MRERLLQVITSILLIITLTMANFLFLCVNFVSYAVDTNNMNKSTNHKNVEFMAYFSDDNNKEITKKEVSINSQNVEVYFKISVKNEGYFSGNITLNNSNFIFDLETNSNYINNIEENKIYLNQINAGEEIELKIKINIIKEEQFDLRLIDTESEIYLNGIYGDSTEKDISINAKRELKLVLVNPYKDSNENAILLPNIITNKIFEIDGQNKRVVQVMVNSGIKDNLYPIEKTIIKIQAPETLDIYTQEVLVNSNEVLATNGEYLTQNNWSYNNETGLIEINIKNKESNGKVSWIKNGIDNLIITYIFDEEVKLNNEELSVSLEIQLYDTNTTILKENSKVVLNEEEKDAIITSNIVQNETSIYKGKLNEGISRDISYKNVININLNNVCSEINVEESKQLIGNQILKSVYKVTKINKAVLENILGVMGTLEIINLDNGNIILTINSNTDADENGDIVITYPENVETIGIKVVSPNSVGKLELETTRTIKTVNKNVIVKENSIVSKSVVSYISNENENKLQTTESTINLNETETSVDLQISRTQLSAMTKNENVEFRITLNSREEKNELFKNPILRLELPKKIENIEVNSINLVYEDELTIKSAVLNNNVIEIAFKGEQTRYKEEAIDGAIILINVNLQTSKKVASSIEQVKLSYTNNGITDSISRDIEIVSYVGVVTTNQISNYGIEIINNEGNETAQLSISDDVKNVEITKQIINNKENVISNVKILGVFPTKESFEVNNIDIEVGDISVAGIDDSRIKVYYSNNKDATQDLEDVNNNWVEKIEDNKDVKKYLVVIDKLEILEEIGVVYQITIPSNLEYNEKTEEGYTIYYNSFKNEEQVTTKNIRLATPAGTVIETTLKTLVAGEEINKVKENGILRYQINVANTGSEDVSNIIVNAKVPENTIFVNSKNINNEVELDELVFTDENKKEIEFTINSLASGEDAILYYEVQINENMIGKNISNAVVTKYGDVIKNSNEVTVSVEKGDLEVRLISIDANNSIVKSGYQYRYVLNITNKSDKTIKNAIATVDTDEIIDVLEMYYISNDNKAIMVENINNIEISKIQPNETIELSINTTVDIFKNNISKNINVFATVNSNDIEYKSNEINLIAQSDLAVNLNVTSEGNGSYVKAGDVIKYDVVITNDGNSTVNGIILKNWISNDVTLNKVTKNGEELSYGEYSLIIDTNRSQKVLKINSNIETGKSVEYKIEVVVNLLYGNTEAIELVSEYSLELDGIEISNAKIANVLQPEIINSDKEKNENNVSSNDEISNIDSDINEDYKIIYGVAWIDENENGSKDISEKGLEGIKVQLIDVTRNELVKDLDGNVIETYTTSTGFYNFSKVKRGQYIVIFEYDTTQYGLTSFEKEGVPSETNSNVITKSINVDGTERQIAATEIINIENENIANINIGLIQSKRYDLQLDKYISKITVQNNKTVTNNYEKVTLVKQEIDAKQINSTTVIVEYTIKITNKGDVAAYVKKIADYLSSDYKFNSELNKDWYQSGNDVYCTSLASETLKPGESKEVKLTVIKTMTENNTGLINNMAEIVDSYNELGLSDINSTEGNKVKGENDTGSADLIISIKTGQVIMTISLIISSIVILSTSILLLKKIIINRKLF